MGILSNKENVGMIGTYREVVRDINTNEVLDVFEESNVITDVGILSIINALTQIGQNAQVINSIWIGDDVGSGTIMEPEAPTETMDGSEQDVLWQIPEQEFSVSYPEPNKIVFFGTINGQNVMGSFPGQPNVVYTSATLRNAANQAFSYKRFTGRTISALISLDVSWTIEVKRKVT